MKKRDVKLTPPAYMHYMEKGWLNPNPYKHNIQCIDRDVKLPHTRVAYKEKRSSYFYIKYTEHESIYRGDVKLPLHISNTYQTNFKKILKSLLKQILKFLVVNKMNYDTNEIKL